MSYASSHMSAEPEICSLNHDEAQLRVIQAAIEEIDQFRATDHRVMMEVVARLARHDANHTQLQEHESKLKARIRVRQSQLCTQPKLMDTLPVELVQSILLHCIHSYSTEPSSEWPSFCVMEPDWVRAAAPFHLAAVCSRWRTLATATAPLWHFITMRSPTHHSNPEALLNYVTLVLKRSASGPLDIVLSWRSGQHYTCCVHAPPIFTALSEHSSRWRSFEFNMPTGFVSLENLAVFQRPTRMLQTLRLSAPGFDSAMKVVEHREKTLSFPPQYLPVSPQLVELSSDFVNILPYRLPPGTCLPHLTRISLTVWWSTPGPIWDLLRAAPNLQQLNLRPSACHALAGALEVGQLHMSFIRHMSICLHGLLALARHLPMIATNVVQLDTSSLHFTADGQVIRSLRPLIRLRKLSIGACTLTRGFFDALADLDPTMADLLLPNLQEFKLGYCPADEESRAEFGGGGDAVVSAVRKRTLELPAFSGVARLRKVEIAAIGGSLWFYPRHKAEVETLLSSEDV
ncbi:hypothetical protein BKA62DRAFT_728989 [Auriculariales sp. MPI-PUGE-AT-0066]|nr:hypothetical protein BKA62DRAFT_728989 [Auriculariales sp. MPI-PUGE-AT-0066]